MNAPDGFELGPAYSEDTTGTYFRAVQTKLARPVTIKFLKHALRNSPRAREIFLAERDVVAGLEHDNLLMTIDVGEVSGLPYIVTECATARTLAELLDRGTSLEETHAVAIALGLAQALRYLESKRLLYKNVRLSNVLMPQERVPKLLTFRNVRSIREAPSFQGAHAQSGAYCAPELSRDDLGPVTIKANVYALGAVFFRMLAGEPPVDGTSAEARAAHATGQVRTLKEVKPFLRDRAHDVVARLLCHDPRERPDPANAIALLEAYRDDPLVNRPLRARKKRRRRRR